MTRPERITLSIEKMIKQSLTLAALSVFAGLILHRAVSETTPKPLGPDASPAVFSAARAKAVLAELARSPRPAGSAENARARDRILDILRRLHVEATVQEGLGIRSVVPGYFAGGRARNIVARISGRDPGRDALLVVGHYDSVTTGPGAGDDMSSCAAMLETIRALQHSRTKFRNDIIFLFSDAEEGGLVGASSFAALHPWRTRVKFVVNFEARGVSGPSSLFETNGRNLHLVRGYAEKAPDPSGTSLANAVYDLMPNDTDFSVFKQAGYRGLNFAFVGGVQNYHTRLDTADAVDSGTMQHHGDNMESVVRHFADADLNQTSTDDAVYFPLWPGRLVLYSQNAATWFIVFTCVGTFLFLQWTIYRGRTVTSVLRAAGIVPFFAASAAITLWFLLRLDASFHPGRTFLAFGEPYNSMWYRCVLTFATLLVFEILIFHLLQRTSLEVILAGVSIWWLVFLALAQFFLPGAAYAFLWPLFFALGAGVVFVRSSAFRESSPGRLWVRIVVLLLAIPTALFAVDMTRGLLTGLSIRAGALTAGVLCFHLLLLTPVFILIRSVVGGWFRMGLVAGTLISVAALFATSGYSERQPVQNSIGYALHADTGTSLWISCDPKPDSWTRQYFQEHEVHRALTEFFPALPNCIVHSGLPMAAPAPRLSLAAPEAVKTDERLTHLERIVRLRIRSPRNAPVLWITLRKKGIRRVRLDGRELTNPPASKLAHRLIARTVDLETYMGIRLQAMDRPVELEVHLDAGTRLEMHLADQDWNLETMPGFRPRPAHSMPSATAFLWPPESTTVARIYSF